MRVRVRVREGGGRGEGGGVRFLLKHACIHERMKVTPPALCSRSCSGADQYNGQSTHTTPRHSCVRGFMGGTHGGSMGDPWGIHRNPSFETHQDPSGIDRGLIGDPLRTISMGIDRNDASTLLPDDARLQFEFQMTHEPTHCCPRMSTGKEGQPPSLRNTAEMLPRVTFSRTRMT